MNEIIRVKERMRKILNELIFIDGLALYYDANKESKRYAIVKENGDFLFINTKSAYDSYFQESIKINELGIFLIDNATTLIDKNSFRIRIEEFELFKTILSNRKSNYKPDFFYIPDEELIKSKFNICKGPGYSWVVKEGEFDLKLGELPSGLIIQERRTSIVGKDYDSVILEIYDYKGNKMDLSKFWQCIVMVKNGQRYLKEFLKYNSMQIVFKNIE